MTSFVQFLPQVSDAGSNGSEENKTNTTKLITKSNASAYSERLKI